MHYREQEADGGGEGVRVVARPSLGQKGPQLGAGAWPLLEQSSPGSQECVEFDPRDILGESRAGKGPLENRLHHGAQRQAVACGDEMDRRAHERGAHCVSIRNQPRELFGLEPLKTRPQRHIRIARYLRLHADEVLNRRGG